MHHDFNDLEKKIIKKNFVGLPWNLSVAAMANPVSHSCVIKMPYFLHDVNAVAKVRINNESQETATTESRGILVFKVPLNVSSCRYCSFG